MKHHTWTEPTRAALATRVKCVCGWRTVVVRYDDAQRLGKAHEEAHRLRAEGRL